MSFETGGRADKQGNVYENRCLALTLIQLITEEITSVVVEPVGENMDICEYYTVGGDGRKTYYQCKGSNGMDNHWAPSDLQRYNLFERVQSLLRNDPVCRFCFLSPLSYNGLDDLCFRADKYSSTDEFLRYALANQQVRFWFEACEKRFNLNRNDPSQLSELLNYLSRCEFRFRPNNSDMIHHLEELIGVYFWGIASNTRVLLENYINDTASYGKEITVSDLLKYLSGKGVQPIIRISDPRIAPVIARLNRLFSESYKAIHGSIIHRNCTDTIIHEIIAGRSVIVHGKAGVGKTGCICEFINYLEDNHIDYLAIQLDKHIPNDYADKYGETLGLPGSPVKSLSLMSGSKPCVLILDQLDSLRWTTLHSAVALDVCKEMINQVRGINENADGHISVVFSVRTFDYENDTGIHSLFGDEEQNNQDSWSIINVADLADEEVKQIIGEEYNQLSGKARELLRVPSSLYVWLMLRQKSRLNTITSPIDMVHYWWKQIQDEYAAAGYNHALLADCIGEIVTTISASGSFSIPRIMLLKYNHEIDFLVSGGMLIAENNTVSFVHQSFLDAFLLEQDLTVLYKNTQSLLSLVLSWGAQVPMHRYRLSALLQNIAEASPGLFVIQSKDFLESDQIHYYYKAAVFEAIGQLTNPDTVIFSFLDKYFLNEEWHGFILQTIYEHHPVFIEHLSTLDNYDWMSEEGRFLLISMKADYPGFVVSILKDSIESDNATHEQILSVLGTEIGIENEELFDLRLGIYRQDSNYLHSIHYIDLEQAQPVHVIQIMNMFLSDENTLKGNTPFIDETKRKLFCEANPDRIIDSLLDCLCRAASSTPLSFHATIDFEERYWLPHQFDSGIAREIVEIVKGSLSFIAKNDPEKAISCVSNAGSYRNGIANELALCTLLELPSDYSNAAIEWILADIDNHILDCISNEYDYLSTCKSVLKRHSPSCSADLFTQIETRICSWKGDRDWLVDHYKYRIEINRTYGINPIYTPAWGHLQKALLPCLDAGRITQYTKDLIAVLNRNEWIRADYCHAGILSGSARTVVSAVYHNAARLSDRAWLGIVRANVSVDYSPSRAKEDTVYSYESTHRAFASDLGACVSNDPPRYAKLLLQFPYDIYPGYYSSVLDKLRKPEGQSVAFNILCDVIYHSMNVISNDIPIAIAHIISDYSEENWPMSIIDYLVGIATDTLQKYDSDRLYSHDDDLYPSRDDMIRDAFNNPRGIAIDTIGDLLIEHSELFETFAPIIENLVQDESRIVHFALCKCIAACYKYDFSFATKMYDILLKEDPHVLYANTSFWIMSRDLHVLEAHYYPQLKAVCNSQNPQLILHVTQQICIAAILTSSKQILTFLYTYPWSEEAMDKICLEATRAYGVDRYHSTCQAIIEHFLSINAGCLKSINRLFRGHMLVFGRDENFIKSILHKRNSFDTVEAFIEFIKTKDIDISEFAEIISLAVDSIDEGANIWQKSRLEDGLVHTVIKLIDTCKYDNESTEDCLGILDKIYRKRILSNIAVLQVLDGSNR